jgi:hypothetical protein
MSENDNLRRRKRFPIFTEFMDYIFSNPDNVMADIDLPPDAELMRMYEDRASNTYYAIYQSDEWEPIPEGEIIPTEGYEILLVECMRCETELLYDESECEQYCPRCEWVNKTKVNVN